MKTFAFLGLLSLSSATLLITNPPSTNVTIGQKYELTYLLDREYILELDLVQKGGQPGYVWSQVKTLLKNVKAKPCNGSYLLEPDDTWPTSESGQEYALWISGTEEGGQGGYADLTEYFSIVKG